MSKTYRKERTKPKTTKPSQKIKNNKNYHEEGLTEYEDLIYDPETYGYYIKRI